MGFLSANENEFHVFLKFVVWLWNNFGKVLESFLKEFVPTLFYCQIYELTFWKMGPVALSSPLWYTICFLIFISRYFLTLLLSRLDIT